MYYIYKSIKVHCIHFNLGHLKVMLSSKIILCFITGYSIRWFVSVPNVRSVIVDSIAIWKYKDISSSKADHVVWIIKDRMFVILVLFMFSFLWKRKDKCWMIRFISKIIFPRYWAKCTENFIQFVLNEGYCITLPKNSFMQWFNIKSMLSCPKLKLKLNVFISNPFTDEVDIFIYLFNLTRFTNQVVFNWRKVFLISFSNWIIARIRNKLWKFLTWFIFFLLIFSNV